MSESNLNEAARAGRPSMCRSCGAIVGAGESECAMCGAPLAGAAGQDERRAQTREPAYDNETIRFARAVLSRPATFTFVLLFANVFVFLLTAQSGALENPFTLVRYGAKVNSLIDNQGQWWRFVAPIFLHGGIAHLLMNMYGLWVLGPYVEKLYGSAKFVVFWVLTGVAGVLASYLSVQPALAEAGALGRFIFKAQDAVSVGASGALFGLVGVLFVFGIKFRHELPQGFKQAFGTGMLPTILINIFIGYAIPIIDNAAHMGGLVAGAALALLINYKRPGPRGPVASAWHVLQVAALALVLVSFTFVARNFNAPLPAANDTQPVTRGERVSAYREAINEGQSVFLQTMNGEADAADPAIEKLFNAPPLDDQAAALRDRLRELLERAREWARLPPQQRQTLEAQRQAQQILLAYQQWQESFRQWVQTNGAQHGLQFQETPVSDNSQ